MSIERITEEQMLARVASAVQKVDRHGSRGVSRVTFLEIEALVMLAVLWAAAPVNEQLAEAAQGVMA